MALIPRSRTALLACLLALVAVPAAADGNAAAGRKKAQACAPCHGIDGIAKLPNAANLAGESIFYLDKQLRAFRSGERQDDQDIDDLVAWYSSIEVTVKVPGP